MIIVKNNITLRALKNGSVPKVLTSFGTKKEIPFLSTYHFNPKPTNQEDVLIPLYVTNEDQVEYQFDNNSVFFKLVVGINKKETFFNNIQIGNYELNLGKMNPGLYEITLKVIDKYGNESHELYNEIWVVDSIQYPIKENETYTATESDLLNYEIKNNNSQVLNDMNKNRIGLTNLMKDIREQGYRKLILPFGIYRVNRTTRRGTESATPIDFPSGLTLDLNGSTIKLHPYDDLEYGSIGGVENLMIRMKDCVDSHLINGILEGDYAERKANGWASGLNGEGNNCHQFVGGSHNSVKNVKVTQITGYSMITTFSFKAPVGSVGGFTENKTIEKGIIKDNIGTSVSSKIDISPYLPYKTMCVAVYLGYGGLKGKDWHLKLHYYDKDSNFIISKTYMQHRAIRIPENAKFVIVEGFGTPSELEGLSITDKGLPEYCSLENIDAIDNRTCFAPSHFQHLTYRNLKFTRSGVSITPCCIDLEDGWEKMQDFFLLDSEVIEKSGTRDLISTSGINHVIQNCKNFRFDMRSGITGMSMENNVNCELYMNTSFKTRKRHRIENNFLTRLTLSSTAAAPKVILKNNTINLTYTDCGADVRNKFEVYDSDITITSFHSNLFLNKCNIKISSTAAYSGDNVYFTNCNFIEDSAFPTMKFSFNKNDSERIFEKCTFDSVVLLANHNYFNSGTWKGCIFKKQITIDPKQTNTLGQILFENCIFEGPAIINTIATNYIKFVNCTFLSGKTLNQNAQTNAIFENSR